MTTVTAQNSFSETSIGPTPGQLRTAASVNQTAAQQPMNNTLALANGYGKRRAFSLNHALTTSDIVEQYVMGETPLGDTFATANVTLQFAASATDHSWKKVHLKRIDQGTVITFQTDSPYTTFLTWTAPANMSNVWLTFNRSDVSVWDLVSVEVEDGSCYEIDVISAGTYAVAGKPKEIHVFNNPFGLMPSGTTNIDLDGDYLRGETVTIYVRGIVADATVNIRNSSNTTLIALTMARDGGDTAVTMRYHDVYGWTAVDAHTGRKGQAPNQFVVDGAVDGTIDPAVQHHLITASVSAAITKTVLDGTFRDQRVTLSCDSILAGGSVAVVFTGITSGSSFAITQGFFVGCELVWNGSRWHVINRSE